MSPTQTRSSDRTLLPIDVSFLIFSYLPWGQLRDIATLSRNIHIALSHRLMNGSFFWDREKEAYRVIMGSAANTSSDAEDQSIDVPLEIGFPRTYIDMWQLSITYNWNGFNKSTLKQWLQRHTAHLDIESFEDFMETLQELDTMNGEELDEDFFLSFPRFAVDREVAKHLILMDGRILMHAPEKWRRDCDIILQIVKKNGLNLEHASEELQNDKDVVLAACHNSGYAVEFASERLQSDLDVLQAALEQCQHLYFMETIPDHVQDEFSDEVIDWLDHVVSERPA